METLYLFLKKKTVLSTLKRYGVLHVLFNKSYTLLVMKKKFFLKSLKQVLVQNGQNKKNLKISKSIYFRLVFLNVHNIVYDTQQLT